MHFGGSVTEPKLGISEVELGSGSTNSNSSEEAEETAQRTEEEKHLPLQSQVELTNHILSYDRFYPGRILGNTFSLHNTSDQSRKL
jgi:hypothetical protein